MNTPGALILAAGRSSRMGRCKALLPLGKTSVLEQQIDLFHHAGVGPVCVVTGFHGESLRPVISRKKVLEAVNPSPEQGMFSSVCAGAATLSPLCPGFFILPVDVPLVRSCTLELLQKTWLENPQMIAMPYFNSRSGHPPLVPSSLAADLPAWQGEGGLQGFFNTMRSRIVNVPVPDEQMLLDMDSPEAYETILETRKIMDIPSPEECLALIRNVRPLPENVQNHSIMVAGLARALGKQLNACGEDLDLRLLEAAGLLHDIARLEPNHGPRGAEVLSALGFNTVAEVIAPHSDMDIPEDAPVTPQEIIFLVDKYFKGNDPVSLEIRYGAKKKQYGKTPEMRAHVENRLKHARHSEKRMEERIKGSLHALAVQVASDINSGSPA